MNSKTSRKFSHVNTFELGTSLRVCAFSRAELHSKRTRRQTSIRFKWFPILYNSEEEFLTANLHVFAEVQSKGRPQQAFKFCFVNRSLFHPVPRILSIYLVTSWNESLSNRLTFISMFKKEMSPWEIFLQTSYCKCPGFKFLTLGHLLLHAYSPYGYRPNITLKVKDL